MRGGDGCEVHQRAKRIGAVEVAPVAYPEVVQVIVAVKVGTRDLWVPPRRHSQAGPVRRLRPQLPQPGGRAMGDHCAGAGGEHRYHETLLEGLWEDIRAVDAPASHRPLTCPAPVVDLVAGYAHTGQLVFGHDAVLATQELSYLSFRVIHYVSLYKN
jgi:hypothetical protein